MFSMTRDVLDNIYIIAKKKRYPILTDRVRTHKYDKLHKFSLRLSEELNDGSHLCSGERLGMVLVALGYHSWPHAARKVHLLTEVAQGRVVIMVGVVHLGQLPEGVIFYLELCHVC